MVTVTDTHCKMLSNIPCVLVLREPGVAELDDVASRRPRHEEELAQREAVRLGPVPPRVDRVGGCALGCNSIDICFAQEPVPQSWLGFETCLNIVCPCIKVVRELVPVLHPKF